jgi:hypothetical protein
MTIKKSPILYDHLLDQLNRTSNDAGIDLRRRLILLRKLEKTGPPDSRRVVMYYSGLERALSPHDFLPFASMLKKIGKIENMDLRNRAKITYRNWPCDCWPFGAMIR